MLAAGLLTASGAAVGTAAAQAAADKSKDKVALGEADVKQLLLLMDADKNGKISKDEYMKFMEAEFNRLDIDKNGELDVKELTQSTFRVVHSGHR
jgi:Ca2+-binding EF-hand superfamily protein